MFNFLENDKKASKKDKKSLSVPKLVKLQCSEFALCNTHKRQVAMQKLENDNKVFSPVVLLSHEAAHNTSLKFGLLAGLNRIMYFKHLFNE